MRRSAPAAIHPSIRASMSYLKTIATSIEGPLRQSNIYSCPGIIAEPRPISVGEQTHNQKELYQLISNALQEIKSRMELCPQFYLKNDIECLLKVCLFVLRITASDSLSLLHFARL